jgi:nitronate monooxygenase
LTFHKDDASGLIPVLQRHRPVRLWLFTPAAKQHTKLISAAKSAGATWGLKVFVQVGSVQAATEAVLDGADVIVVQGSDAGGHQFAKNTSLITLSPEVADSVKNIQHVSILAAGGIMVGRGCCCDGTGYLYFLLIHSNTANQIIFRSK